MTNLLNKNIKFFVNDVINKLKKLDHLTLEKISNEFTIVNNDSGTIYFFGNGASASISDHLSTDLTKVCKIKSRTFNNSNLLTCFSNDYGYQNSFKEIIKSQISNNDLCVFISCSGESKNVVNAAKYCVKKGIKFVSFTGFDKNSSLKKISNLNYFVESNNYNVVETVHQTALLSIVESLKK